MLPTGTKLAGRYEILGLVGAGGMGNVYRARDRELDREVALKVAGAPLVANNIVDDSAGRFDREARAIARLDHPSIVRILDYGRTRRHRFIAMPLLEGPTLTAVLASLPQLAIPRALQLTRQLLSALVHAHACGVIHRDIKPDNIVLVAPRTDDGLRPRLAIGSAQVPVARAVLVDFGLAYLDGDAALTARGMCVGSPSYLAPERLDGMPCDVRADLYAIGAILYEMVAGRRPFVGDSTGEILLACRTRPPRPLRAIRREVSAVLDAFVARALAKDPARRFASAAAMLEALDDVPAREQQEQQAVADARDDGEATFLALPASQPSWMARLWSRVRYGRWRWRDDRGAEGREQKGAEGRDDDAAQR